jgi:hypothetical protein
MGVRARGLNAGVLADGRFGVSATGTSVGVDGTGTARGSFGVVATGGSLGVRATGTGAVSAGIAAPGRGSVSSAPGRPLGLSEPAPEQAASVSPAQGALG